MSGKVGPLMIICMIGGAILSAGLTGSFMKKKPDFNKIEKSEDENKGDGKDEKNEKSND